MSTAYRQEIETTAELAAWYNAKYESMGSGWETPPEECHRHLDDLGVPFDKARTLLDVGFGAGHFLAEAEKRVRCVGCDISAVGLEYARLACKEAQLLCCSIENEIISGSFDYITALGSLEHVVDIDKALDNIYSLLKPDGKWYFLVPNDLWPHRDQPNERTFTPTIWRHLFEQHGLATVKTKAWGPHQDAYWGYRNDHHAPVETPDVGLSRFKKPYRLNVGSGQRPFGGRFINIDTQEKWSPDLVSDMSDMSAFEDASADMIVSHHVLEHLQLGDADAFLHEANRILQPGGSFIITVPDIRALAERWLAHQIDDYTYVVNLMGAFAGDPADTHKWHLTYTGWREALAKTGSWTQIKPFDWRPIEDADIARSWWILGIESIK